MFDAIHNANFKFPKIISKTKREENSNFGKASNPHYHIFLYNPMLRIHIRERCCYRLRKTLRIWKLFQMINRYFAKYRWNLGIVAINISVGIICAKLRAVLKYTKIHILELCQKRNIQYTVCTSSEDRQNDFGLDQAPVPLSIFRSNSKFDENSKHSGVKYTLPITTIFCTRHDSVTVVMCAKYRCDRSNMFETRAFWIFIEFRIRSKYA